MRAHPLGSTGLTVTPMGLGLAALGRPAYINLGRDRDLGGDRDTDAMERRTHEVLDAAYASGVRYVDAARSYGFAEAFLASWFDRRGVPPDALTVGSKWGYTYVGEWRLDADIHEVKDHSLQALRRQLEESRQLLGDRLHLYQVHSATMESGVLQDADVIRELGHLRSKGLVIGLTVSGSRQGEVIRRALDLRMDGENPFQAVQATWNLLEPSAGPALAEAHGAGWGVLVKEALANGRLTPGCLGPEEGVIVRTAHARGLTVDQLAMAAALANPWADVVLSGAVTVDQLHSNLGASLTQLSSRDLHELQALAQPPETYWRERAALRWS